MTFYQGGDQLGIRENVTISPRKEAIQKAFAEAQAELKSMHDAGMSGADVRLALSARQRLAGEEAGTMFVGSVHFDFPDTRVFSNVYAPAPTHTEMTSGVMR